jgi:hypothetical protein
MKMRAMAAAVSALLAWAPQASAGEWQSAQPVAEGVGAPAAIGEIGDISFWAPNRGMLITAGNEGVEPGLFAFDGSGWYRYSTVCGGHQGKIAWAGPDDFWTVSDQQAGQQTGAAPARRLSLCHFVNGAVVASYAEPLGVADSYLPMDAAACVSPSECWFAGERLPGSRNVGAFHLHWDGSAVTPVPSLTQPEPLLEDPGRSVTGLAYYGGTLYEGVRVQEEDEAPGESSVQPTLIHQVAPGSPASFFPVFPTHPVSFGGAGAEATELEGFLLSADAEELWAASGAIEAPADLTFLRLGAFSLEQVTPSDPEEAFAAGDHLGGIAAEPQGGGAWVSFSQRTDGAKAPARLAFIRSDGTVERSATLPAKGEGLGPKGQAGPIACPSLGQCWMATSGGWLFHLGVPLPQDPDPALHVLVTYRPSDASLPSVPPVGLPEDDSGLNEEKREAPSEELALGERLPRREKAIYTKLRQKVVDGHVLQLTFVLREKAHVRLIARRRGHVVAKTPRYTMKKGPQQLRLALDPKHWPTKIDLEVHKLGKRKK